MFKILTEEHPILFTDYTEGEIWQKKKKLEFLHGHVQYQLLSGECRSHALSRKGPSLSNAETFSYQASHLCNVLKQKNSIFLT